MGQSLAAAGRGESHVARGVVFAGLGGVCWGFSGTCAQLMTSGFGVPVAWITCVRLTSAAVIFLAICLVREPRHLLAALRDRRSIARIAAFALLGVLMTQVCYLTSISYTNAGTGTVFERLGLLVIMGYVCVRKRRLPKPREAAGLLLAMGGTVLIATKGNFGALAIPAEGLFWGVASAFSLAFYTLLPGKVLEKWGSFIVTGLAMLIGGSVAAAAVQPWTIPVEVTPELVAVMAAMVVMGTFAAYLFYLQGITDAGPVRAGLVGCVEPVSATVISALWLGTPVGPFDVAGCAMIIAMVLLVNQRGEGPAQGARAYDGAAFDLPPFQGRATELGYYRARRAERADFKRAMAIIEDGHTAMAQLGVKEGIKKYPSARRLMRAIEAGSVYVVVASRPRGGEQAPAGGGGSGEGAQDGRVIGLFALDLAGDPAYARAAGAQWLSDSPPPPEKPSYAALHWTTVCADARRRGVGGYILGTAERLARAAGRRSIRADVYPENAPMRALLQEHGYQPCGLIEMHGRLGRTKRRAAFERVW